MTQQGDDPLKQRWPEFRKLRSDASAKRIVIGIDRSFARVWGLFARTGTTPHVVLSLWFVYLVMGFLVATAAYVVYTYSAFLICAFLLGGAFLAFRLATHLAVGYARIAALHDEKLFRAWFRDRKLSILVRKTGDIVYQP